MAHAFSVLCRHSFRHPEKGQRNNEKCRQEWRDGTPGGVRHIAGSWGSAYPTGFETPPESGRLTAAGGLGGPGL